MADQLYLSLWFPNFRFADLPAKVISVLHQFARVSGLPRVAAAAAYPISFSEAPVYQRLYVLDKQAEETADSLIENAVAEAMELLHEDTAYEFETKWQLWSYEAGQAGLDGVWRRKPETVKLLAFGPEFDDSTFEQNGHLRIDFGLDAAWVLDEEDEENLWEDDDARDDAARHIKENVEMLLAFTLLVEKHCGISSRLLWTESGEPLAEKLVQRLQRIH